MAASYSKVRSICAVWIMPREGGDAGPADESRLRHLMRLLQYSVASGGRCMTRGQIDYAAWITSNPNAAGLRA
jgi:hypothetical protein